MTFPAKKKSSFTLPASEIKLVLQLKKMLKVASNTEIIRQALKMYYATLCRDELRKQFRQASHLVSKHNSDDAAELDLLNDEVFE